MKKLGLFLEGTCEKKLCEFLLIQKFPQIKRTLDVAEFIQSSESIVLLYDCIGHENVFPRLKEYKDSNPSLPMLAVRDLEEIGCYLILKDDLLRAVPTLNDQFFKPTLFAKPELETIYSCDLSLLKRVMVKLYKESVGITVPHNFEIAFDSIDWTKPVSSLKTITTQFNMAFKKVKVAEKFFSQLNFEKVSAEHPYFQRMISIFKQALSNT
jgi:hypothetical protein